MAIPTQMAEIERKVNPDASSATQCLGLSSTIEVDTVVY